MLRPTMSTEWLVPIGFIVLAIFIDEPIGKWVFGVLGVLMLGYFLGRTHDER